MARNIGNSDKLIVAELAVDWEGLSGIVVR
jgi:hypothetical protein